MVAPVVITQSIYREFLKVRIPLPMSAYRLAFVATVTTLGDWVSSGGRADAAAGVCDAVSDRHKQ